MNIQHTNHKYMEVIKRDGTREPISFDKILKRVKGLANYINLDRVDPCIIAQKTVADLYDKIETQKLDFIASVKCAEMIVTDPQYSLLGGGIMMSNLHKNTKEPLDKRIQYMYDNNVICERYYNNFCKVYDKIKNEIDYDRDYTFDYFAYSTLDKSYLLRVDNKIIERPQDMFLRVAIGIHETNIDRILDTYHLMSNKYFTHASPTLYNIGTNREQLSSCFLVNMDDSIEDIFETIKKCAHISKYSGGIGLNLSNIRVNGSKIKSTNGVSDGIKPLMQLLNSFVRYVNQSGKRKGALACYLEPWHADIMDFLQMKTIRGSEDNKARDLFFGLWVPDLFMERVEKDEMWSLMCPDMCPGLNKAYGEDFRKLYTQYEKEGKFIKQVSAKSIYYMALDSQIESGTPYMLYKDSINVKSNQKNIGPICCSNLCAEVVEHTSKDNIAVCTLASICLKQFIKNNGKDYDFEKLKSVARSVARNLNMIIDLNLYPVKDAENSNNSARPFGIGVQGLADLFCMLKIPFESQEARILNQKIFESIYYGAVSESVLMAKESGTYEFFEGSPTSQGKLQYHLWGKTNDDLLTKDLFDWDTLVSDVQKYGLRNSLTTAVMPTASTSQLMGNQECIEPFTSNHYLRSTQAGQFVVLNKYLVEDLIKLNLWTDDIINEFIFDNGSIQNIDEIPDDLKNIYKTAFELKIKSQLQLSADRGPFIDQTQSLNIFSNKPHRKLLYSVHSTGWKLGLKTGMYYLRSQPSSNSEKFGLSPDVEKRIMKKRGIEQKQSQHDETNNYRNKSYSESCKDSCGA